MGSHLAHSRLCGAPAFVLRRKAIGINNGRSALALSEMATKAERLAECEPALAREISLDHGAPQDQHIDSGYLRRVEALRGIASGALTAAVPQGCTHGTRPASSSAMILSVISW